MKATAVKALLAEIAPVIRDYQDGASQQTLEAALELVREVTEPLFKRIGALSEQIALLEARPMPEKGEPGEPGKDAPEGPRLDEIVTALQPIAQVAAEAEVAKRSEKLLTRAEADEVWNARIKKALGDDYPATDPKDDDLGQS